MFRLAFVFAAAALTTLTHGAVAHAGAGTDPPAATAVEVTLFYPEDESLTDTQILANQNLWTQLTGSVELDEYFNSSVCTCGGRVIVRLRPDQLMATGGNAEVWAGDGCNKADDPTRDDKCEPILAFEVADFRQNGELIFIMPAELLMFPTTAADCTQREGVASLWVLFDTDGVSSTYEEETEAQVTIDTEPPPEVDDYQVLSAENAVVVKWNVPADATNEIYYYQVLCRRTGDPNPIFPSHDDAEYRATCEGGTVTPPPTPDAGVPDPADAAPVDGDAAVPDADLTPDAPPPADAAPAADAAPLAPNVFFDPAFICGTAGAGATSIRVNFPETFGLVPGQFVEVTLLVIDKHRNVRNMSTENATPVPVADFWEVYEEEGGSAVGGYCFVATAAYGDYDHPYVRVLRDFRDESLAPYPTGRVLIDWYYTNAPPVARFIQDHPAARLGMRVLLFPVVVGAGLWVYTGLAGKLALALAFALVVMLRRRLRARRASFAPAAARVTAAPRGRRRLHPAAAGAIVTAILLLVGTSARAQAVWDEEYDNPDMPSVSHWNIEIKFGPYLPAVDSEPGIGDLGPYELMFGNDSSFMTQLELDWFFWQPFGQLGLAGGVGYTSETAKAFLLDEEGNPVYDDRMEGDLERAPADDTSFKLLPLWFGVTYRFTPLADRTVVPVVPYAKLGISYYLWWITKGDGSVSNTDMKGDAKGGTLGWQGSVGLAVRADAFDPQAARNLEAEMGIHHAGFFVELTYADVSGLGMADRLHVGDLFWLAGANFEF